MKYFYRFDSSGKRVLGPNSYENVTDFLLEKTAEKYPGSYPFTSADNLGTSITATIENGKVVSIQAEPGPTKRYVSITIGGNSSQAMDDTLTFIPGDTISISMELKKGPEPDSETWTFSTPPGRTLSVPIRKDGLMAGRLRCAFVNGVCNFNLPITEKLIGDLTINQADLTPFSGNQVVLLNEIKISVEIASA